LYFVEDSIVTPFSANITFITIKKYLIANYFLPSDQLITFEALFIKGNEHLQKGLRFHYEDLV